MSTFRRRYRRWHASRLIYLVAYGAAFAAADAFADDSLGLLRDEVRAPSVEPDEPPREEPEAQNVLEQDDEPSLWGDLFGDFFVTTAFVTVGAPFWVPHAMHDGGLDVRAEFPRLPYDQSPGYMVVCPSPGPESFWWSTRLTGEYADFERLDRIGMHALFETSSRWGADASFYRWSEDFGWPSRDRLWTGDCNLLFRFVQCEYLQMRTGLGMNWLADRRDMDVGFNFTYGGDLFPVKPLVVSADLDWGWLGGAGLFHFRSTAGVLLGPVEAFAGFDYYDVGRAQFDGFIAGVRFWL